MAFTQDELQSLNSIFEQKLLIHRRELERTFDQRMLVHKRELEQRLTAVQQELQRSLSRRLADQQNKLKETFQHKSESQQERSLQAVHQDIAQQQQQQRQHFEDVIEHSLAAQLLAFEQLISQRPAAQSSELAPIYMNDAQGDFDSIEVQTEIPWEDLVGLIDKVLDERLSLLSSSIQSRIKDMERLLAGQIQSLREVLVNSPFSERGRTGSTLDSMQDVFSSIDQLERLIESMQVAMTANSALLSNRLYHHQHLPLERAHPQPQQPASSLETVLKGNSFLSIPKVPDKKE